MLPIETYQGIETAWCPGCGNFGNLKACKQALAELEIKPENLLLISGIGQSSKFPHYLKCNTMNGIHGRTLPLATIHANSADEVFITSSTKDVLPIHATDGRSLSAPGPLTRRAAEVFARRSAHRLDP